MRQTLRGVHRIKLAHNFGAGFFEHVAHLHCQIVEEFAQRRIL